MKNIFDKNYSKQAFEQIQKLRADGSTYEEVAKEMNKLGYCGINEKKLIQPVISRFMIEHGVRTHREHDRHKQLKKGKKRRLEALMQQGVEVSQNESPEPLIAVKPIKRLGNVKGLADDIFLISESEFSSPEIKKQLLKTLIELN